MALGIGSRIAHYEILAPLGKGGMGEVFRARDTKLGREVAIKVLPEAFAANQERLIRFEREAKVLAALNHPNIATIYAIEESPEGKALVMELVPGAPIAGPLSLADTLRYATQLASALDAAHEKGITHRDLKPANIMLTPDGTIKVLDFGLASVSQLEASDADPNATAPTLTMSPTRLGMILGTAPYMSPEQARGLTVDKRTDIWAFGVTLWELLTGKRLFQGSDVTETLAAVVMKEPDFAAVPFEVRRLLAGCLEKDLKKRVRDIGDWERLLDQPAAPVVSRGSRVGLWIASGVAAAALAALGFVYFTSRPATLPVVQISVTPPEGYRFSGAVPRMSISPDGSAIAVSLEKDGIQGGIAVRRLDETTARIVVPQQSSSGAAMSFWSYDSQSIAFFADGKLKRVPAQGGPVQVLCDAPNTDQSGTWNRDGVILFSGSDTGEVWRVSSNGGPRTKVLAGTNARPLRWLHFLPDGKHFLYFDAPAASASDAPGAVEGDIKVASIEGDPSPKAILKSAFGADYADGFLFFVQDGSLVAQRLNLSSYALEGQPALVLSGVGVLGNGRLGASLSANGNLAVVNYQSERALRKIVWVDAAGKEIGDVADKGMQVQLSPSGKQIAYSIQANGNSEIWFSDLTRLVPTRLSTDSSSPVWSPDEKWIAYRNGRSILKRPVSGLGDPETIIKFEKEMAPWDWSRDGQYLLISEETLTGRDLYALPLSGPLGGKDAKPVPLTSSHSAVGGRFSPDSKWVAYASRETGSYQVFVRSFPGNERKIQVSRDGGFDPQWKSDGKALYFNSSGTLLMVPVKSQSPLEFGDVVRMPIQLNGTASGDRVPLFAPNADGSRFLVSIVDTPGSHDVIRVVQNWQGLLKK